MKEKLQKIMSTLEIYKDHWDTYDTCGYLGNKELKETDDSLALIDSILAMLDSPWQPIETAPEDTAVLLWVGNSYLHRHIKTGIVNPRNYDKKIYSYWYDGDAAGLLPEEYVSHWMPLPEQP